MHNNRSERSVKSELTLQMERGVRPAEASLAKAEASLAEIESGSRQAEIGFRQADAAFQRLVAKKAPAEEVGSADTARREALRVKRLVAGWLDEARQNLARAKARLKVAQACAARLQAEAAEQQKAEATAKVLCSFGVSPASAHQAAAAPVGKPSAAPVPRQNRRAKARTAPKQASLKLDELAGAWGATVSDA